MRSEEYFVTLVVLVVLALSTTGLRFAARRAKKSKLWYDDALIVVGCVVLVGLLANAGVMYIRGRMGAPMGELLTDHPELVHLFMKCFYASTVLYFICMLPVKLSILTLYMRVWTAFKGVMLATKIAIVIQILWFLGGFLPTAISCIPHGHTAWDMKPPTSQCLNMSTLFRAITISNLLTDFIVLIVPIFAIRKLKLEPRKKVAVACLFLMGSLACFCELLRIVYQEKFKHADLSTNAADCAFWTIAEPAVAVIAANLPCLKPLVPEHSPLSRISGIFSSGSRSASGNRRQSTSFGVVSSAQGGNKAWFGKGKASATTSTTRTMSSDEEDAIPLTEQNQQQTTVSSQRGHKATRSSSGTLGRATSIKDKHMKANNPYMSNIDNSCWSDSRPDIGPVPATALSPGRAENVGGLSGGIYVKQEFQITSDDRREFEEEFLGGDGRTGGNRVSR